MVRTSPFAWAKRWNPKSPFHGRLLYQVPAVSFPKRTNISQDTISHFNKFFVQFGCLFQILQPTKEGRPFLRRVFKGSQLLIRWPGRGPQRWRRWLGHPNCRCVPPVPDGKKHQNNTIAWDEILATSTHQESDSWLLFTNEWKAQAATTAKSLPKFENCCLFHSDEVVTTQIKRHLLHISGTWAWSQHNQMLSIWLDFGYNSFRKLSELSPKIREAHTLSSLWI